LALELKTFPKIESFVAVNAVNTLGHRQT